MAGASDTVEWGKRAGVAGAPAVRSENAAVAAKLEEFADLLAQQEANPFRVRAYRQAAEVTAGLDRPVSQIVAREGRAGLVALPAIGEAIAADIAEMTTTGRWSKLARMRGGIEPEALFSTLPGVGPKLAHALVDDMHLGSLEALETAAHSGALDVAPGWGRRRVAMVRAAVAERLGRPRRLGWTLGQMRPSVDLLLDVDRQYRRDAAGDVLKRIAPKRFNPAGEAWLPILHTERGPWRFTALYSNTARAHELKRVGDWVVIYYHTDHFPEGQCTVVTEPRGALAGRRVVRGREAECAAADEADAVRDVDGGAID